MVPQMSKNQQNQVWQFWQEVSKQLQNIISGALDQSIDGNGGKHILQPLEVEESSSKLTVDAGVVSEGESTTTDGKRVEELNKIEATNNVSQPQEDDFNVMETNENGRLGSDSCTTDTLYLVHPEKPGKDGSIHQTGDSLVSEVNIVIEMDSAHQESTSTCPRPPATGTKKTKLKNKSTADHADSGILVQNRSDETTPAALNRVIAKGRAKRGKRISRSKKNMKVEIPATREQGSDGVLAAIHEANKALKGGEDEMNGVENATADTETLTETSTNTKKSSYGQGRNTCEYCSKIFPNKSALEVHLRVHTGDRPYRCSICNKGFTTKCNVRRHEATHAGLKPFQCEECHKFFTEKKSLKVHMRIHTGERPYKCDICDRTFAQVGILKSHMHVHTGFKGHLCDHCGKSFSQKTNLRSHLLRHANKRQFKCETCPASFICSAELKRHRQKHTGERPFLCWLCPKTFTRLQYLKEHINLHTGNKPYSCKKCNAAFPDLSSVHKHMKKQHNLKKQSRSIVLVEDPTIKKEASEPLYMQTDEGLSQPGAVVEVIEEVNLTEAQVVYTNDDETLSSAGEHEVRLSVMHLTQPENTDCFDNSSNIVLLPVSDVAKPEMIYDDAKLIVGDQVTVDFSAISLLASASAKVEAITESTDDI